MKRATPLSALVMALVGFAAPAFSAEPPVPARELFTRQVQPLLKVKCLGCHGDEPKLRGGLDLRSRQAMLKGGDSGPALVPGDAAKSLLYKAVLRTGELVMPPKETAKLSKEELTALKSWIDAGAPWPTVWTVAGKSYDPKDTWAYQPIQRVAPPKVGHTPAGWPRTPIDQFILAKLAEKGMQPALPAEPRTLIRRLYFDLTGLPPGPEEVELFCQSAIRNPQSAIEKLADRLLASPRHGERMAQHWLDVVRYADTSGFANDYERPHAWRYRDYVIRAFNADKPFDRFILEQIAGDELDADDSEARIAAGYLRMGPWEHTGMSVAAVTRQMWLDDVTNSVGVTFLGQGLSCARCHDHKFDPVPTRDYYRIQAVFAGTQFAEPKAAFLAVENTSRFDEDRADVERRFRQALKAGADHDAGSFGMITRKRDEYHKLALKRFEPLCFSVQNGQPQEVAILKGGSLEAPGDVVGPGVLSAAGGADIPAAEQGRRLALARWIAGPNNPLTARVIVNRVWQWHFGTGLVATPNNFGKMGGRPSHPELLDWLARWFIDNDWSLKKLHRLIVTSAVYALDGRHPQMEKLRAADPNNRLLAYFPPRRLTAEEVRDAMLAASGELDLTSGGPGVFPEMNGEVALQPRHVMGGIAPAYQPSPRPQQRNRRTIYAFRIRTLADPMHEVLNRPGTEMSCERRDETTVTPQVFALFNGQFSHDRALALARRVERATDNAEQRIDLAFRLVFGRAPTDAERQRCREHVARMTEHHRQQAPIEVKRPALVVRQMVAERTGEVFRWEEPLDVESYQPDLKPWNVGPQTRGLAELCLVLLNANEFVYVY